MFVVELCKDCWLADWDGDPGRTTHIMNSKVYLTKAYAELDLEKARKFRKFESAEIRPLEDMPDNYTLSDDQRVTKYWWYKKFGSSHIYLDGNFYITYGNGKVVIGAGVKSIKLYSIDIKYPTVSNIRNLVRMLGYK